MIGIACSPFPVMGTKINKWVDVPLMWNAAFCSGLYFYVAGQNFETTLQHIPPQVEGYLGQVLLTGVGTGAVCPGPQGPQTVLNW